MFKVYNNVHREIIINHFSKKSIIYPIRDINNFNIFTASIITLALPKSDNNK